MTDMKEPLSLAAALQAVAQDIDHIGKDQKNAAQGFKFRGIDDVLNAMHGPLSKHGVSIVPSRVDVLNDTERATAKGSAQFFCRAMVTYEIVGPDGDSTLAAVMAEASDMGDKVSSKLMSMAYKYLLFQLFCIPVEGGMDDADADTPEEVPAKRKMPERRTKAELLNAVDDLARRLGVDSITLTSKYRETNGHMSPDDFAKQPVADLSAFVQQVEAYAQTKGV